MIYKGLYDNVLFLTAHNNEGSDTWKRQRVVNRKQRGVFQCNKL